MMHPVQQYLCETIDNQIQHSLATRNFVTALPNSVWSGGVSATAARALTSAAGGPQGLRTQSASSKSSSRQRIRTRARTAAGGPQGVRPTGSQLAARR